MTNKASTCRLFASCQYSTVLPKSTYSLPTVYLQSTVQYRQTVLYFLHYSTVPPTVGMGDLVTSKKQHKKRPEASQKPSLNAMKDAGCGMCGATCNVELKLKLVHQTTAILHQYHVSPPPSPTSSLINKLTNKKIQQAKRQQFNQSYRSQSVSQSTTNNFSQ